MWYNQVSMTDFRWKRVFVDGFKVRNTLEVDFNILGRRSLSIAVDTPKFWIPEGEVWIDHRFRDESDFLIRVATFITPTKESGYRSLRALAKEEFCDLSPNGKHVLRIEKKGELAVVYVDGEIVRRTFDPEFVMGGHSLVYDYIPEKELWIDAKLEEAELPFILEHEEGEYNLMKEGSTYESAHDLVTVVEKNNRRKLLGTLYPGDEGYPWEGLSNEEIIKKHYVIA